MNGIRHLSSINGVIYSWSTLTVSIAGVIDPGVLKIDYSDDQTIDLIYGIGQTPIGRGYGNITPKASITLTRRAIESMRMGAPITHRLQDIPPFDIVVCFAPLDGGAIVTHKLRSCVIKNDPLATEQGKPSDEATLELSVMKIER